MSEIKYSRILPETCKNNSESFISSKNISDSDELSSSYHFNFTNLLFFMFNHSSSPMSKGRCFWFEIWSAWYEKISSYLVRLSFYTPWEDSKISESKLKKYPSNSLGLNWTLRQAAFREWYFCTKDMPGGPEVDRARERVNIWTVCSYVILSDMCNLRRGLNDNFRTQARPIRSQSSLPIERPARAFVVFLTKECVCGVETALYKNICLPAKCKCRWPFSKWPLIYTWYRK